MRKVLVAFSLALVVVTTAFSSPASAATTYSWHIADDFLEQNVGSPPWAIASAPNGDTIQVDGNGVMEVDAKTATGGGRFIHNLAAGGSATGTFTADSLISFQFYGCGGAGLPDNLCGGLAKLAVTLTPDADPTTHFEGILWIDCLLGEHIPAGGEPARHEGIRLNARGINFNHTEHSGFTVFVLQ